VAPTEQPDRNGRPWHRHVLACALLTLVWLECLSHPSRVAPAGFGAVPLLGVWYIVTLVGAISLGRSWIRAIRARSGHAGGWSGPAVARVLAVPVAVAVLTSALVWDWPLRTRLAISKSALDELATLALSAPDKAGIRVFHRGDLGALVTVERRVGAYYVIRMYTYNDPQSVDIVTCAVGDSRGGFTYHGPTTPHGAGSAASWQPFLSD
jgi:hypothetical protein